MNLTTQKKLAAKNPKSRGKQGMDRSRTYGRSIQSNYKKQY